MLRWLQKVGPESAGLTEIHTRFLQMLDDGRHIFDAAANCVLGGGDSEMIRDDLYTTDKRINLTEQRIRREIVVHGTVHGAASFPALLIMMSLVKDAERIGDYAKNLFDLAAQRPDLGSEEERAQLIVMKDQISRLLARTHGLFENQDATSANDFLRENDALQDHCDDEVDRVLAAEGRNLAGMVLTLRFFKRITSHAGNIVTSIVMPLDKLDYFPGKPHSEQ
jgi:phosphate uptake regulator